MIHQFTTESYLLLLLLDFILKQWLVFSHIHTFLHTLKPKYLKCEFPFVQPVSSKETNVHIHTQRFIFLPILVLHKCTSGTSWPCNRAGNNYSFKWTCQDCRQTGPSPTAHTHTHTNAIVHTSKKKKKLGTDASTYIHIHKQNIHTYTHIVMQCGRDPSTAQQADRLHTVSLF